MNWDCSQAKRVCDACFGGDPISMRKHADAYLNGGHTAVPDLGVTFRQIVRQQARASWWRRAKGSLDVHLDGSKARDVGKSVREPPDWTAKAGGKRAWKDWVRKQAVRCTRRATLWKRKHRGVRAPTFSEWSDAIWSALRECDGRGYYSRLPLSLETGQWNPACGHQPWESARWPSVDHVVDPVTPKVVIEARVFNDMKSILDEEELRDAVSHLAHVLRVQPKPLPDSWCCRRSFGAPQPADEPPLPQ